MMAKKAQEKKLSDFGQLKGTPPLDAVVEEKKLFYLSISIYWNWTLLKTGNLSF